ncbi:MAG: ribonuclease HII [Candidatus Hodarchaeota archaeon]
MSSDNQILQGIAGVDEAGRGPMIGPLVVSGVLIDSESLSELENLGVRDSKLLTPKKRRELAEDITRICARVETRTVSASEIDTLRGRRISLNDVEANEFAAILKDLRPSVAYLDAADVIAKRFGETVGERSGLKKLGCKIVSEHKADSKYLIVSAASIIAKDLRDRSVLRMHEEYGDFGSGYPSDPKTVKFVTNLVYDEKVLPPIIRKSWESVRRIVEEFKTTQSTLDV